MHRGLFGGRAATTHIVNRFNAGSVPKNTYAAGVADDYEINGKTDWWLPSLNELAKIQKNIANQGLMNVGSTAYWSSSEYSSQVWKVRLDLIAIQGEWKSTNLAVLPVRGF